MSFKISLGGDVVYYLGAVGFFKALDEANIFNSVEIHCSGFSCIPAIVYFAKPQIAYNVLSNAWEEAQKVFKNAAITSLDELSKNILLLYKMSTTANEESAKKKIQEFLEKFVPAYEIKESDNIKVHAFDISEGKDTILLGDSREVLLKALPYPLDFSPVNNFISSSWVFGIPEGDGIIYLDWIEKNTPPRRATDYLLLATFARTSAIVNDRIRNAKFSHKINLANSKDNFRTISLKFYQAGQMLVNAIREH
ncbi:MAG: hypothetical protein ACUVQF_08560 [Fervidobacterium sp.]|uniref:hypothetical protein n=1 Tax=Fervidobacterium sp. TaxID=1871331 RepID=UPI0040497177